MRDDRTTTHGRLQDANGRLARHAADYRAAARALAEATGQTATVTPPPSGAPVAVQLRAMRQASAAALRMLADIRTGLDALEERVRVTDLPAVTPA